MASIWTGGWKKQKKKEKKTPHHTKIQPPTINQLYFALNFSETWIL